MSKRFHCLSRCIVLVLLAWVAGGLVAPAVAQQTPARSQTPAPPLSAPSTLVPPIYPLQAGPDGVVRCGTMQADAALRRRHPELGSLAGFEQWLQQKIAQRAAQDGLADPVLTVPVVVHVVHNGEPVGSGPNLSEAQIRSQMRVLNEDFRRLAGTPGDNNNPVSADTQVEFVLASRAPDGRPTDGIDRVDGGRATWVPSAIDGTLKPATVWDPALYLNMWTADLGGGLLGYAQFPSRSGLSGIAADGGPAATDGVVMQYTSFGDTGTVTPPYDGGRTTTHEVGHWLGLRHVWGDGGCGDDDYCADTPLADGANYSCPGTRMTCGSDDQNENYMDYTDDACMNLFTADQKTRMRTVLDVSPRRLELDDAWTKNAPVANDAGLVAVESPGCLETETTPVVTLRNYGTDSLRTATFAVALDDAPPQTLTWTPSTPLAPHTTGEAGLPTLTVPAAGADSVFVALTGVNGGPDEEPANDGARLGAPVTAQPRVALPIVLDVQSTPFPSPAWTPAGDGLAPWRPRRVIRADGTSGIVAQAPFYDADIGARETLRSPPYNLDDADSLAVAFDVAYAPRPGSPAADDRLALRVSTDCGGTFASVYDAASAALATTGPSGSSWTPLGAADWRTETVDLSPFFGDADRSLIVEVAATSGGGNNIFVSNLGIDGAPLPVELAGFEAVTPGDGDARVRLTWRTLSETNNAGFAVEYRRRAALADADAARGTATAWTRAGFVPGAGTTTAPQTYGFTLPALPPGAYVARLRQVDFDGAFAYSPVVEFERALRGTHALSAVYPNPFARTARLTLTVAEAQDVTVAVYNALGQRVALLHEGPLTPGRPHAFALEAGGLASGVYLVRAVGARFQSTRRVTLVR